MNDTDAAREEARAWRRRTYAARDELAALRQVAESDRETAQDYADEVAAAHVERDALRDRMVGQLEHVQRLEAMWRGCAGSHEPGRLRTHDLDYADGVRAAYTILRAELAKGGAR